MSRTLYKACPMCKAPEKVFVAHRTASAKDHPLQPGLEDSTMRWMRCSECCHIFTDGYFGPEDWERILSKTNPHQSVDASPIINQRGESARVVERVRRALDSPPHSHVGLLGGLDPNQGRWLDVGFGSGSLAVTAQEMGFDVSCIEVREANVQAMRALGLGVSATRSSFEDYPERADSRMFNVISFADVLEHLPYPIAALKKAVGMLCLGGILYISCPNRESAVWKLLDRAGHNPYWGEIEHYHNFSADHLSEWLIESLSVQVEIGVSNRYLSCMELIVKRL